MGGRVTLMSWSSSTPVPVRVRDIGNLDQADLAGAPQTQPEGCEEAYDDQLRAALDAAEMLCGGLHPDASVKVSLSGHANPNHEPHDGWADEAISVAVYVQPVVTESAVTVDESGNVVVDDDGADDDTQTEAPSDDPLDGNVDSVVAYADGLDDRDELTDLLARERAGKDRSGVTGPLEARLTALDD